MVEALESEYLEFTVSNSIFAVDDDLLNGEVLSAGRYREEVS